MSTQVVDYLDRRCACGADLFFEHGLRKYCKKCNEQDHAARNLETAEEKRLKEIAVNYWLRYHNLGRAFSTFGKHEPMDKLPSVSVVKRKDRSSQGLLSKDIPTPVNVQKTSVGNAASDNDRSNKQKPFSHSHSMPRAFSNFCTECVEMVIGGSADTALRVTKGVYLPIGHQCNVVRVYDLAGKLLEVKPL